MKASMRAQADAQIFKNRERETYLNNYTKYNKVFENEKAKTNWELKTDTRIKQKTVQDKRRELMERAAEALESRRERLAELFQLDDIQYQKELKDLEETPEQVRRKMAERLHQLQDKRREEQNHEVQHRLQKRDFANIDDLRKLDSEAVNVESRFAMEDQMKEKCQRREQDRLEEEIYALLNKQDMISKEKREKQEREEKEKLNQERLDILDWQRSVRETNRLEESEKEKREKEKLRSLWKKEELNQKETELQKKQRLQELNREIIRQNEIEKEMKLKIEEKEKEGDKYMIKKVVEFENKEELAELEERKRKLEEAKGYLIQSNTVTEDQKRAERELEQYVLQQQAELNTKMDNQWRREDQARVGLMTDVYSNMREVVQRKQATTQVLLDEKMQEKKLIQAQIEKDEEDAKRKLAELAIVKKKNQQDILTQIAEKEERKRREKQEAMYELRAAKLAELQYRKKVEGVKEQYRKTGEEFRSKRPF